MKSTIHEEFVKIIRQSILNKDMAVMRFEKNKVVSILSDILCLGREAIYRRLRGEVKFSLEEISLIALKLDISIDSLVGLKNKEKSLIELNFVDPKKDFKKVYEEKVNEQLHLFKTIIQQYDDSMVMSAFNRLPYMIYFQHPYISKFRLFKWAYQMNLLKDISFKDFVLSKELRAQQNKLAIEGHKVKSLELIASPEVFASFVKDIDYFYDLGLVHKDDCLMMKEELCELLDEMEEVAITGKHKQGADVLFYISDLDLNFTNTLFKYGGRYYTYINVYDLGGIESQNESLCEYQVGWITAQKRYSKLITQSNEKERHRFFKEQRELVNRPLI